MAILLYATAWFSFAIVHSLLARSTVQKLIEAYLGRWYRLSYNLLAVLTIAGVLFAGRHWLSHSRIALFDNKIAFIATSSLQILGYLVLIMALAKYDIGRFAGITQVITGERVSSESSEPLQKNGLNRWVRHPLYTGAFLALWGGAVSSFELWTAVWGTIYLLIGTVFEERKLVRMYGDDYRRYKQEVPRYFPFP